MNEVNLQSCECCGSPFTLETGREVHHYHTPDEPTKETRTVCRSCNGQLKSQIWGVHSRYFTDHILPDWELQKVYVLLPKTDWARKVYHELLVARYGGFLVKLTKKEKLLVDSSQSRCPMCGSTRTYRYGKRKIRRKGQVVKVQAYHCDSCFHQWRGTVVENGGLTNLSALC